MKYGFFALVLLVSLPLVFAQIVLPPAETSFTILSIVIEPPPDDDFTGTSQIITLQGDLSYLRIGWKARYFDDSERNIGVKCYLNCPDPGSNIDLNCAAFQKCEYLGLVGSRSCTVSNPNYQFNLPPGQFNTVACKFYDPLDPTIEYLPYPTRTFRPLDYSLSVSPVTATVNEPFIFPATVIPSGLIASTYTLNVTEISDPNVLTIDRNIGNTEELSYGQAGRFFPNMVYLVSKSTTVQVLGNANLDPVTCTVDADCSYLGDGKCVIPESGSNRCWKRINVQLKSGFASLSEFDVFGFLQIMTLASAVLFVIKFRRK